MFPRLSASDSRLAIRIGDESWSYAELSSAALAHAVELKKAGVGAGDRVGVWAYPSLCTVAAIVGNLAAGAVNLLLSPKLGSQEVDHILSDAAPRLLYSDSGYPLPRGAPGVATLRQRYPAGKSTIGPIDVDDRPALILYTSGTTGAPKGAVITRRNIAMNLDALASAWDWSERDTVVHALPLIHVHGLVLGLFGSLRAGGALHHVPRFSPDTMAAALSDVEREQTVLFGVPTMYHRLADAAEHDETVVEALRRPRLLVSGSAGLPVREHERIAALTGRGVHERYGLTETLINCGIPASEPPRPGYVGAPLWGVELKLVDDARLELDAYDDETIGEVVVRSPSVFAGYLNLPEATAAVVDDEGWFYTGDLATRTRDGAIRVLGRRSTDLIKTGGYRVGAGEIEACLLEHPATAEVAVVGAPDDDLGQRILAFLVVRPDRADASVASFEGFLKDRLSPHKRPREIRLVHELPRNAMGKVQKKRLLNELG